MAKSAASKGAEVVALAKEPESLKIICLTLLDFLAALYTFLAGVGDIGAVVNPKESTRVMGE
jgi:hypothetical protein